MDLADAVDWIRGDAAEMSALLREFEPDEPVAACPGWTAADLSNHLAQAYAAWYPYNISTPADQWTPDGLMARFGQVGEGHHANVADFEAGVAEFVDLCSVFDLDAPTWSFGGVDPARWWVRRAGTELTVHLTDAAGMRDRQSSTAAACQAEGVDEVLTEVFPRLAAMKAVASALSESVASAAASPPEYPVALVAEDTERAWTLARGADGLARPTRGLSEDVVAVGKGSTSDVLAWLHGRPMMNPLSVEGDSTLLDGWNLFHRSQF